jgi:hypothetical protein
LLGAGVVVSVSLAYLWPSLVRSDGDVDLVMVLDGRAAPARDTIERALRTRAVRPETTVSQGDACEVLASVRQTDPSKVLVLSAAVWRVDGCAGAGLASDLREVVDLGRWRSVVVLLQPGPGGQPADSLEAVRVQLTGVVGVTVADPSWLFSEGEGFPDRVPCQWWELGASFERTCGADGRIAVRDESGSLVAPGWQRLARVLEGAIP